MTVLDEVTIAGVPWPVYKLLALAIGLVVMVIVAVATRSAATVRIRGELVDHLRGGLDPDTHMPRRLQ
ncbi:MAG: hypothetical protein QOC63_5900 [Mycobacterium sp.]|jgi:hypothetical protein|nr:hypothetical protein [Mycobacterium sp.]